MIGRPTKTSITYLKIFDMKLGKNFLNILINVNRKNKIPPIKAQEMELFYFSEVSYFNLII